MTSHDSRGGYARRFDDIDPPAGKGWHPSGFRFEIDGMDAEPATQRIIGGFKSVSGLSCEVEVVELSGIGIERFKPPGPTKFGNIVLKKGYISGADLPGWRQILSRGSTAAFQATVRQVGRSGHTLNQWVLRGAIPTKWRFQPAAGGGVAVEEMTIAHESIVWRS